jgi:hypothetical protein
MDALECLNPMRSHNQKIVANMSEFIKRNKKLLHLNMDSTSLTESMLFNICKCLTRAQSCVAFHVSGNPGITQGLKDILWRRVRCTNYNEKAHKIKMEKNPSNDEWRE